MTSPTAPFGSVSTERAYHQGQIRLLAEQRSPIELAHGFALVTIFGGGLFAVVGVAYRVLGTDEPLITLSLRAGIILMLLAGAAAAITSRKLARLDRRIRLHVERMRELAQSPVLQGGGDDDPR